MPLKEMSIQELARDFSIHLHRQNRRDGTTYMSLVDGAPEWMRDAARKAHGNYLPDDWTYIFIKDAVDIIKEYDNEDEARDQLKPNESYGNLTEWLGSRMDRIGYCDEALECMGHYVSMTEIMQDGQLIERSEVFEEIYRELSFLAEHFRFMIKEDESAD